MLELNLAVNKEHKANAKLTAMLAKPSLPAYPGLGTASAAALQNKTFESKDFSGYWSRGGGKCWYSYLAGQIPKYGMASALQKKHIRGGTSVAIEVGRMGLGLLIYRPDFKIWHGMETRTFESKNFSGC